MVEVFWFRIVQLTALREGGDSLFLRWAADATDHVPMTLALSSLLSYAVFLTSCQYNLMNDVPCGRRILTHQMPATLRRNEFNKWSEEIYFFFALPFASSCHATGIIEQIDLCRLRTFHVYNAVWSRFDLKMIFIFMEMHDSWVEWYRILLSVIFRCSMDWGGGDGSFFSRDRNEYGWTVSIQQTKRTKWNVNSVELSLVLTATLSTSS